MAITGLVLQGGGAPGAFEPGIVECLLDNGIVPDVVSGVSDSASDFSAAGISERRRAGCDAAAEKLGSAKAHRNDPPRPLVRSGEGSR